MALSHPYPWSRKEEPALITEAEPSLAEQQAARRKRYVITMMVRAVAVVLAAVFYHTLWLAVVFMVLGTVLPWIAVIMANDRPPRKRQPVNRHVETRADRMLEDPSRESRVIDG